MPTLGESCLEVIKRVSGSKAAGEMENTVPALFRPPSDEVHDELRGAGAHAGIGRTGEVVLDDPIDLSHDGGSRDFTADLDDA